VIRLNPRLRRRSASRAGAHFYSSSGSDSKFRS
jgi:hypothetical protein